MVCTFLQDLQRGPCALYLRMIICFLSLITIVLVNLHSLPLFSESYFRFIEILMVLVLLGTFSFLLVIFLTRNLRTYAKAVIVGEILFSSIMSFLSLVAGILGYIIAESHSILSAASLSSCVESVFHCCFAVLMLENYKIMFPTNSSRRAEESPNFIISLEQEKEKETSN